IGAVEISSGALNNIFDDISDAERVSGDVDYRKIYVKNTNIDTWAAVKAWISKFTESEDDEITILRGGIKSTESTPTVLTGTATVGDFRSVTGIGTSFLTQLAQGEKIYNSSDDAEGDAIEIGSIEDDTHLTLLSNYGGTAGSGKTLSVAGIDECNFVSPNSKGHSNVLSCESLSQDGYAGIWIKRVVTANAEGKNDNEFKLKFESS
ncbi:hypothetical protein KA005_42805, partial [bacterium]|nr:hypothetical protein [bacterium]